MLSEEIMTLVLLVYILVLLLFTEVVELVVQLRLLLEAFTIFSEMLTHDRVKNINVPVNRQLNSTDLGEVLVFWSDPVSENVH